MGIIQSHSLRQAVEEAASQLVAAEHRPTGSFIRTPLLYPSGASVVVRVEGTGNTYFVSDMGLGYQDADMMGASLIYAKQARSIAQNSGVGFDEHAFFALEATRDQIAGAAMTIANCSLEAATLAAFKLSERKISDEAEQLYQRLVGLFTAKSVAKDAEVVGASSTKWHVATLVRPSNSGRATIFEPVTKHHASVATAATKFHDIARLEPAPNRVAVVYRKQEFGTYLGVLSQAADVVDRTVPDKTFIQLARAA